MKHTQGEVYKSALTKASGTVDPCFMQHIMTHDRGAIAKVVRKSKEETEAISDHMTALWNAANGMPTEEAVKYIEHGREMVKVIKGYVELCELRGQGHNIPIVKDMLAKLEAK